MHCRMMAMKLLTVLFLLQSGLQFVSPTHVRGTLRHESGGSVVTFLTKFGVEQGTKVVAFGTAERIVDEFISLNSRMTLAFIPHEVWDSFYAETQTTVDCEDLMNSTALVNSLTPGDECLSNFRSQDYLRRIPCYNETCGYQPSVVPIVQGNQFTFLINSSQQTEYYYLTYIACTRNGNISIYPQACQWASSDNVAFAYDIQIVNSGPVLPSPHDPFTYQFPYNLKGILITFIVFTVCYAILVAFHFGVHTCQCTKKRYYMHRLIQLFTVSLVLETFHILLEMVHYSVYAQDGMGVIALKYLGEICNKFSDWLLILVLILIGKGWQVTTCTIRWKSVTVVVWAMYIFFSAVYFVWLVIQDQVYPYSAGTENEFQTWAGGLYLGYRLLLLLYILFEVRQVYLIENRTLTLRLYIGLVVVYVVWFCYLPLFVIIASVINPVQSGKVVSTSILTFDLLMDTVMVLLFCPLWSNLYFQFDSHINELRRFSSSLKAYGLSRSGSTSRLI